MKVAYTYSDEHFRTKAEIKNADACDVKKLLEDESVESIKIFKFKRKLKPLNMEGLE